MSGKNAQIGFYFQNLFVIDIILRHLLEGDFKGASTEQLISEHSSLETDLVIRLTDESEEVYEIKSGEEIKNSIAKLRDPITQLYEKFQEDSDNCKFNLVVKPPTTFTVSEIISAIKYIKEHVNKTQAYRQKVEIINDRIGPTNIELFCSFIKNLEIIDNRDFDILATLVNDKIKNIKLGIVQNCDYGLTEEDLTGRLLQFLNNGLINSNKEIDIIGFCNKISDWLTRNKISQYPLNEDLDNKFTQENERIISLLNDKFPSVPLINGDETGPNMKET